MQVEHQGRRHAGQHGHLQRQHQGGQQRAGRHACLAPVHTPQLPPLVWVHEAPGHQSSSSASIAAIGTQVSAVPAQPTSSSTSTAAITAASGARARRPRCAGRAIERATADQRRAAGPRDIGRAPAQAFAVHVEGLAGARGQRLAMAMLCPKATSVSASASVARRGRSCHCSWGQSQRGQASAGAATVANCQPHCQTPRAASNVAAPSANSKPGARGHQRRVAAATPGQHPHEQGRPRITRSASLLPPGLCGVQCNQQRRPLVKPSNTVGEMKCVTAPRRSAHTASWMTPRTASDQRQAQILGAAGHGQRRQAGTERERERIGRPRDHQAAGAQQRRHRRGRDGGIQAPSGRQPSQCCKAMPCGTASTAASTAASASARSVAPFTSATARPASAQC